MEKFGFFGVYISATNLKDTITIINTYDFSQPDYVCFPDTYVVALSQNNEKLKNILNNARLTLPDGKPSVIFGKKQGHKNIDTVSGYWLCKALLDTSLSHYFLGSTDARLQRMMTRIGELYPRARIAGYSAPSFVTEHEALINTSLQEEFEMINNLKPDLIWIGISSPKQDYIMHNHLPLLKHGLMLGVGGVFDYLSEEVSKSPEWIKKIGLRWAWRLAKEPGRLWGKYFFVFKTLSFKYIKAYLTAKGKNN
jgi:N-acetylglucosaminyldiphosphoundecaprenol N-acetyl-beta-D-mannosaminyltransferase